MIVIGYLVAAILAALGFEVLASGWVTLHQSAVLDQKNLLVLAQVAMAFVGAMTAAILTATVGRSNEYLRANLTQSVNDATERLRATLSQETSTATERLKSELTQSVNESTERLKADLAQSGDKYRAELNQVAPRRHAAYHITWASLSGFFRAVQKFEAGVFDEDALKAGENACAEASGQALLMEKIDNDLFHDFWQELARLHEIGEDKSKLPDGLRTIWRNNGKALGDQYESVRQTFANKLLS